VHSVRRTGELDHKHGATVRPTSPEHVASGSRAKAAKTLNGVRLPQDLHGVAAMNAVLIQRPGARTLQQIDEALHRKRSV